MPPEFSGPQPRLSRYALFAVRLKDAHSALRDPRIPAARRAELTKRVLAITAVARHDVTVAATRLENFFSELPTWSPSPTAVPPGFVAGDIRPDVSSDLPPSAENTATQG